MPKSFRSSGVLLSSLPHQSVTHLSAAFDFYQIVQIFPESDEITPFPDCGRGLWAEHKGAIIGPCFRQHRPPHSLTPSPSHDIDFIRRHHCCQKSKIIHCLSSLQQAEGLNSPLEQVGTTNVRTEN